MKTQIIALEAHDDLISVRDRMSWAKTPRILLVWPKFEKVSLRQVDLKVLQRHAASLGAQLGLVTRAARVRQDAEALGIPVFESAGDAQRLGWPRPVRRRWPRRAPRRDLRQKWEQMRVREEAWRTYPAVRVGFFSLGVLAVLVVASLFIPRAQITIRPLSKTQSVTLPIVANPNVDAVFITGSIPARTTRVIVSGAQTINVTGKTTVPLTKARGVVRFRNLTQQTVNVPVDTVIRTVGAVRFVTVEEGIVDAGLGKTLDLPIEAMEAGTAGNVDANLITAIEGSAGLSLAVTNPEPTTGGSDKPSVEASDADRVRVKEMLVTVLDQKAKVEIQNKSSKNDLLFPDTLAISQVLDETYDMAGTTLTLTMRVEYSASYASASDMAQLASLALNASLPSGFSPAPGGLTFTPIGSPSTDADAVTRWSMRAERRLIQQVDEARVIQLVQGHSSRSAVSRLQENLPLAGPPEISLSPSWWPWLPLVPFRISVVTR